MHASGHLFGTGDENEVGEDTQDDVCHVLVGEEMPTWLQRPRTRSGTCPKEPAASAAGAAVAGAPAEFPPSRAGAMSKFHALSFLGRACRLTQNKRWMHDGAHKTAHFQKHDFGHHRSVFLHHYLRECNDEPAPATINFGTALPQTRASASQFGNNFVRYCINREKCPWQI